MNPSMVGSKMQIKYGENRVQDKLWNSCGATLPTEKSATAMRTPPLKGGPTHVSDQLWNTWQTDETYRVGKPENEESVNVTLLLSWTSIQNQCYNLHPFKYFLRAENGRQRSSKYGNHTFLLHQRLQEPSTQWRYDRLKPLTTLKWLTKIMHTSLYYRSWAKSRVKHASLKALTFKRGTIFCQFNA